MCCVFRKPLLVVSCILALFDGTFKDSRSSSSWRAHAYQVVGSKKGRRTSATRRDNRIVLDGEGILSPFPSSSKASISTTTTTTSRRNILLQTIQATSTITAGLVFGQAATTAEDAWASGGATAGRYTTIPIAKRRYYGRVQQGVHDFLEMGPDMVRGDLAAATIQSFFDVNAVVIIPAKRQDISGQCTKKDGDCRGKEIRDSRYNDMKASMYLLANAFRTDQQKPPDRLPTVKAARAFFASVNELQKAVTAKRLPTTEPAVAAVQQQYATALDLLDAYLDLVELPPTESGHYEQEFDTGVGESARIT